MLKKIKFRIVKKQDLILELGSLISRLGESSYGADFDKVSIRKATNKYLVNPLKENLYFSIEYPYNDKVFSDSFYLHYSRKNMFPSKYCIRIGIFDVPLNALTPDQLLSGNIEDFSKFYKGFITFRPTIDSVVGRSAYDPSILKSKRPLSLQAMVKITSNIRGENMTFVGFPFMTQDGEVLRCSGTTIWAICEFYGVKSNNFKTLVPSTIIKILRNVNFEKQLPSIGLNADSVSFALKKIGFGVRSFHNKNPSYNLQLILNDYIESGMPVICFLESDKTEELYEPHSYIIVGHSGLIYSHMKKVLNSNLNLNKIKLGHYKYFNFIDSAFHPHRKYTIIDDNYPPYQNAKFDDPVSYYPKKLRRKKITGLLVPIHDNIYLDSPTVRTQVNFILQDNVYGIKFVFSQKEKFISRFFLANQNSFKNFILNKSNIEKQIIDDIVSIPMSEYSWICEFSTLSNFTNEKNNFFIVIDSTGRYSQINQAIILIAYPDRIILTNNEKDWIPSDFGLKSFGPFKNFSNLIKK